MAPDAVCGVQVPGVEDDFLSLLSSLERACAVAEDAGLSHAAAQASSSTADVETFV
jgi:hypothetical protein